MARLNCAVARKWRLFGSQLAFLFEKYNVVHGGPNRPLRVATSSSPGSKNVNSDVQIGVLGVELGLRKHLLLGKDKDKDKHKDKDDDERKEKDKDNDKDLWFERKKTNRRKDQGS